MTADLKLEDCLRTAEGDTRRDIATLLKFRDGVESYNPIYLFWDLYSPQTDIGLDMSPPPASLQGGRVTLFSAEDFGGQSPAPPLPGNYEALLLELLEVLHNRHRIFYEPDSEDEDFGDFFEYFENASGSEDLPFPAKFKKLIICLHVAAARAFRIKQSNGYSEDFLDCLHEVERTRDRLELAKGIYVPNVGTYLSVQHSAVAVSATVSVELGRVCRRDGRYDQAFRYFAKAVDDFGSAAFLSGQEGCSDDWPTDYADERKESRLESYLREGVKDLSFKEIADTFDALKGGGKSDDYDWSQITNDCASLQRAPLDIFGDKYDQECETLSERIHEDETDDWGNPIGSWVSWPEYWLGAREWASAQLSPSEYRTMRAQDERDAADRRLKNYFFGDSWTQLPSRAQAALISADQTWNSRERGRRESILNELLRATEEMCYEFIWRPLAESKESSLDFLKFEAKVTDRHSTLSAREYVRLCKQAFFQDHLRHQELADKDIQFLRVDLPNLLGQLIDRRNPAEHETGSTTAREVIEDCYRRFLGISQPGVLPELARIGRKLRGGRRGGR